MWCLPLGSSAVVAKHLVALCTVPCGERQRKTQDLLPHGRRSRRRGSIICVARQRDMGAIRSGLPSKAKPLHRLAQLIVQYAQALGHIGGTQHCQAMAPEFRLIQYQLKGLEWHSGAGFNGTHLIQSHIADEMQSDMPVCRCVARTATSVRACQQGGIACANHCTRFRPGGSELLGDGFMTVHWGQFSQIMLELNVQFIGTF